MGHVPHVYLPAPWPEITIPLTATARHHLERVLRARPGDEVGYTDGMGTVGAGTLADDGVVRADERSEPPPSPRVVLAVAPPKRQERARVVVEKLAELGVDRLVWLDTTNGGHPPRRAKAEAWAIGGLEQSRGAWLLDVAAETASLSTLSAADSPPLWVAEPGATLLPSVAERGVITVAIGPEAGFVPDEIPADARSFGLGGRILRVETAAVASAVLMLARTGRLDG